MTDKPKPKTSYSTVPSHCVRLAAVDYALEIGSILGRRIDLGHGVTCPAPAVGHWSLLELLDSQTAKDAAHADALDVLRTAYVMAHGRAAVDMACMHHAQVGKRQTRAANPEAWTLLDRVAVAWAGKAFGNDGPDLSAMLRALGGCFTGFDTMPDKGGRSRPWLFAGEGIASVLRAARALNLPPDAVLWDVPLALVGHMVAAEAEAGGTACGRPRDKADIRRQLRLRKDREDAGMLHPWQIERPDIYRPTTRQLEVRPALAELHALILAAHAARKGGAA